MLDVTYCALSVNLSMNTNFIIVYQVWV